MRQQNWLGMLQVGGSRHWNSKLIFRLSDQCPYQFRNCSVKLLPHISHEHPELGCYHLVAAASRMQLCPEESSFSISAISTKWCTSSAVEASSQG